MSANKFRASKIFVTKAFFMFIFYLPEIGGFRMLQIQIFLIFAEKDKQITK